MQNVKVCNGPHCKARGGGCNMAEIFKSLPGDHEVVTVGCMHRCLRAPVVKVDLRPVGEVEPSAEACRKLLAEGQSKQS